MAFIPPINTRLPHATPGGIGSALALVVVCQGQLLFRGGLKDAFGRPNANEAAGATLMRIDLQKVDAEIAALRSRLAAINDDLDECRIGYFEHPWAWSQMRRALTSERHRVQRRLEPRAAQRRPSSAHLPIDPRWALLASTPSAAVHCNCSKFRPSMDSSHHALALLLGSMLDGTFGR